MTLLGKVALVTGGSRGIGAATARALAAEGATVAISYSASAERAAAVVADLERVGMRAAAHRATAGGLGLGVTAQAAVPDPAAPGPSTAPAPTGMPTHRAYRADQGDPDAVARLVKTVAADFGRLDILVNNAAVYIPGRIDEAHPASRPAPVDLPGTPPSAGPPASVESRPPASLGVVAPDLPAPPGVAASDPPASAGTGGPPAPTDPSGPPAITAPTDPSGPPATAAPTGPPATARPTDGSPASASPTAAPFPTALARLYAVNLTGVTTAIRAAATVLADNGRIITVGSMQALRPAFPGVADYAATKAAIIGFSKGAARDLAPRGITVNVVQPGSVATDMNPPDGAFADVQRAANALGRFGTPEEIAAGIAFLAGPGASFITGAVLDIDGGYSC